MSYWNNQGYIVKRYKGCGGGGKRVNIIERFWDKIDKTDSCWLWKGHCEKNGYGRFSLGKTLFLAHRFSYMFLQGYIPKGLTLDHLCRNPKCVNPLHLEPVPIKINLLRGNGVGAVNIKKTHCSRGHPYANRNLSFDKKGKRVCKACRCLYEKIRRAKKKQMV